METESLKRYSAAEVTLLLIFALGLMLSLLLVKVRSRVDLAEPLELPFAGIAAALPKGDNWETAGGWRYESDNAYVLLSRMRVRGRVAMNVRWRYALCDEWVDPEDLLKQRAESAGGHLVPLGQAPGPVQMQYARIYAPTGTGETFLVGVASLDFGRRLELHISFLNDPIFAENVFLALVASLVYTPTKSGMTGIDRVQQFFDRRIEQLFNTAEPSETGFIIRDPANRPQGYAVRRFFAYNEGGSGHRRVTARRLQASGLYTESDMWMAGDDASFAWTTKTWTPQSAQPRTIELRADAAGRLTVQTSAERLRIVQRTPMMLPDIFLSEFAAELLAAGDTRVHIDILRENGSVIPARLEKIDPEKSPVRAEQAITIVRAEYLHSENAYDDFIFDQTGQLIGRFEQEPRQTGRLWDTATLEQLRQHFGERVEPRRQQTVWRPSTNH